MTSPSSFMQEALALARANVAEGGRPFGAVVVHGDTVVSRAANRMHATHDPTAHAELLAIRHAGQALGASRLDGCQLYASGHPCPMCLAAAHLSGISAVYYAYSNDDAEPYGLSTAPVYAQMALAPTRQSLPVRVLKPAGEAGLYEAWAASAHG